MGEWLQEWTLGEGRAFQNLPLLSSLSGLNQHTWGTSWKEATHWVLGRPPGAGCRGNVAPSRTLKLVRGTQHFVPTPPLLGGRIGLEESSGELPKPPNCTEHTP